MAFQQALSGLNSSSKAIDATSNNIANSSTVGYKASTTNFGDVYAASLNGSGASQIGIGVNIAAIQQQFTQGNITSTNNPLDISINGGGFFRMSQNGAVTFARNGQFQLDRAGFVINDNGQVLTGYPVNNNGTVVPSTPVELQLSASQIPPRATSSPLSGNLSAVINLDSRETNPAVSPFNPSNPDTYTFSTGLSVYDTLGVSHTLTTYYGRTGPGAWTVYSTLDGAAPQVVGNLTFDASGALTNAPRTFTLPSYALTTGATTPWSPGTVDFTGTTQYGSESGVDRLTQGGYAAGALVGVAVGDDGVIQGRYSNGQTRALGQVVLANFTNANGLQALGNNQWAETSDSGPALLGAPGSSSLGVLSSSSVEESNVDLTAELVNLITQQRNYQANAQSIKTQDQIMQTLVNLR